jgi:hypothetical protein
MVASMANEGSIPTAHPALSLSRWKCKGLCDPEGDGPLLGGEASIEAGGVDTRGIASVVTAS